jgi:hypothetical protein
MFELVFTPTSAKLADLFALSVTEIATAEDDKLDAAALATLKVNV